MQWDSSYFLGAGRSIWTWIVHLGYGNVQEFVTWIVVAIALFFAFKAASAAMEANEKQSDAIRAARETNDRQAEALSLQRRELESLELKDRRVQADRVAAWLIERPSERTERRTFGGAQDPRPRRDAFAIKNNSELPITAVWVYCYGQTQDLESVPTFHEIRRFNLVPPQVDTQVVPLERELDGEAHLAEQQVGVFFRDAAGNYWERRAIGRLLPLSPESALMRHGYLGVALSQLSDDWRGEDPADAFAELLEAEGNIERASE